jgi:hypothetical protein
LLELRAEIEISEEPQPPIQFSSCGIVDYILEDLQTGAVRVHRKPSSGR